MADIDTLKQALSVSPENVPLILLLGGAYLETFHFSEAREQYDRALGLDAPAHQSMDLLQPFAADKLVATTS